MDMFSWGQCVIVLSLVALLGPYGVRSQNAESIQDFLNSFCREHPNNKGCHQLPPQQPAVGPGGCSVGSRPCADKDGQCLPIDIPCDYIGSTETCTLPPNGRALVQPLVCGGSGSIGQRCDRQFKVPLLTEIVVQCRGPGDQQQGDDIDILSIFKPDSGVGGGAGVYRCLESNEWTPVYEGSPLLSDLLKSCYYSGCGRLPSAPGNAAINQPWPWVRHIKDGSLSILCSATMVADNALLTAAHCVTSSPNSRIPVDRLERLVSLPQENIIQHVQPTEIYIHPGYTGDSLKEHDIAIVKISLQSGETFPHACLPPDTLPNSKPDGVVFRLEEQIGGSRNWRTASATNSPSCSSLQSPRCSIRPQGGQFCAHQSTFQLDEGSSGGPYLTNVSPTLEYTWVVLGVYSRAHRPLNECNPNYVFNSAHLHRQWIQDCVLNNICRT